MGFEVGSEGISGLGGKAVGRRVPVGFWVVVVVVVGVLAVTVVVVVANLLVESEVVVLIVLSWVHNFAKISAF